MCFQHVTHDKSREQLIRLWSNKFYLDLAKFRKRRISTYCKDLSNLVISDQTFFFSRFLYRYVKHDDNFLLMWHFSDRSRSLFDFV